MRPSFEALAVGTLMSFVVVLGGFAVWHESVAWHDTGIVQSVGHENTYADFIGWQMEWSATVVTQSHGTIVLTSHNCHACDLPLFKVNETLGITVTNGGDYTAVWLY